MSPTIVMSPITFKQQVEQLVAEVTKCIRLCRDIRACRNIGSRHENLDRLQSTLEAAEASIPMAYNTTRRLVGSQFETGDGKARTEMDQYVVDLQTIVKPRLRRLAQPSKRHRHRHEPEQPGFADLLSQWKALYQSVSLTMLSLSRRISSAATPDPIIRPAAPPKRKTDEITISLKEFDHLLQHVKNSWEEVFVGGRSVYVNVHDPSVRQWEMPVNAYVKTRSYVPPKRSSSYERRSPSLRMSDYE